MYNHDDEYNSKFTRRTLVFGGVGFLGFAGLSARLYKLQVLDSDKYRGLAEENQFNYRLLVPSRGQIVDRKGRVLASNSDNFRLLLMPYQVRDLDILLSRLSTLVELSSTRKADIRKDFARRDPFSPVRVVENMDWNTFARVNMWLPDLPGVMPEVGEVRDYPLGKAQAHIIGYVGRVPPEQVVADQPLFRHPGFRVGRTGVERNFDLELRGKPGALKYEVNALGRVIRELPDIKTKAKSGKTVSLTLDRNLQNTAMQALDGTSGAACVLDVKTGEVIALVSTPSFDPNKFVKGISTKDYNALLADEFKPLFNKAIGGSYPPASCFKMVVAMAAFDAGLVNPKERIRCTGKVELGDRIFHCWKRRGHGLIDLNSAIGVSCDIYFYELAKRLGIDRIHKAALKFGFGTNFDLDLGGGSSGLVPSQAWKRARFDLPWAQGETLIAGIGQGYLAATPIQLAIMTARIATGKNVHPVLQYSASDQAIAQSKLDFSDAALAIARNGMASVVNKPWGTAYTAKGIDGKNTLWAGKTGTGQVRRISQEERDDKVRKNEDLPWKLRDHALFVGYAPLDKPQFAISVIIEHGGSGSAEAAPRARKILKYALEQRASIANSENKNGEML